VFAIIHFAVFLQYLDDQDKLAGGVLILLQGAEGRLMTRSPQIKEHYTRLIPKLDDRYLRAMLYHAALEDWSEVLAEDLPLPEKLIIALRYLSDLEVTKYLQSVAESCRRAGDLIGLMITGLTPAGMQIIQSYVDLTGDVQSAALLSGLVCPTKFYSVGASHWLESYRQLLMGWGLRDIRAILDISHPRNHRETPTIEPDDSRVVLRCNFCGKAILPFRRIHGQSSSFTRVSLHCRIVL
jgi:WD repeat-containing protein mio